MKETFNSTTKFVLVLVILAIIALTLLGKEVTEPLKTIALMIVSFYFGQKIKNEEMKIHLKSNTGEESPALEINNK